MKDTFTVTYPIETGISTEGFYQEVALDSPNGIASINLIGNYPPLNVGDKVTIWIGDDEMNLQERIEALETEIKALKAEVQQEDEFPKFGDSYHFMDDEGEIVFTTWCDDNIDQNRLAIGNVFRTEEEAEFAVEKLKVEAELRKFGKAFEAGEMNIEFYFNHKSDIFSLNYLNVSQTQGAIYFESEVKAQQAIEAVGEGRIKKYIFGVED